MTGHTIKQQNDKSVQGEEGRKSWDGLEKPSQEEGALLLVRSHGGTAATISQNLQGIKSIVPNLFLSKTDLKTKVEGHTSTHKGTMTAGIT